MEKISIDLTPTWVSLVPYFLAILHEKPDAEYTTTIRDSIRQMAQIADLYTALAKAAGMDPQQVDHDELIARIKPGPANINLSSISHALLFLENGDHFSSPGAKAEAREIRTKLVDIHNRQVLVDDTITIGERREIESHLEWILYFTLKQANKTNMGIPGTSALAAIRSATTPIYNKLKGIE